VVLWREVVLEYPHSISQENFERLKENHNHIYGIPTVGPGDLTPKGRKTFELFYDFLIILEI